MIASKSYDNRGVILKNFLKSNIASWFRFNGSLNLMLADFIEEERLPEQEIKELKRIIGRRSKGGHNIGNVLIRKAGRKYLIWSHLRFRTGVEPTPLPIKIPIKIQVKTLKRIPTYTEI